MKENFEIDFDNLTEEDKENFLRIVEKAKTPIKKREKLKNYYFICNGEICYKNTLDITNEIHYIMGNYFQTKEDAEFAMKKQIIYQKLKDYALGHNKWENDWEKYSSKFCIAYDYQDYDLFIDSMQTVKYPNTVYFTSEKIAANAIKEIGEDKIKYYLFGIED